MASFLIQIFKKLKHTEMQLLSFGASEQQAQALVDHHVELTGISRHIKFKYFLSEIMHQEVSEEAMSELLKALKYTSIKIAKRMRDSKRTF